MFIVRHTHGVGVPCSSSVLLTCGVGACLVPQCSHRTTKQKYAVKCITKAKMSKTDEANLAIEITVLRRVSAEALPPSPSPSSHLMPIVLPRRLHLLPQLRHPHIVAIHAVFENDEHFVYIVQELMTGGELFDFIVERVHGGSVATRSKQAETFDAR